MINILHVDNQSGHRSINEKRHRPIIQYSSIIALQPKQATELSPTACIHLI